MPSPGLIDVVDAAYDLELAPGEWLSCLTQLVDEVGRGDQRTASLLFTIGGPASGWIKEVAAVGLSARETRFLRRGYAMPYVMDALARYIGPPDAMPQMSELSTRLAHQPLLRPVFLPFMRFFGFDDLVALAANDGTGSGVIVNFIVSHRRQPEGVRRLLPVLPHISAALRVRRSLAAPEVRLATDGLWCPDGDLSATDRERLRHAVVARDRAHTRAGRAAPEEALEAWNALVDGRWSLLDAFERNGARYVVAIPNLPPVQHPRCLTPLERAVLALMMLGRSNKAIGWELGLATGTISSTLAQIRRKLGRDILDGIGRSGTRVTPLRVGDVELTALVVEDDEARGALLETLPPAEREVARLALDGLGNAEIAARRGVSERTVANQLASLFRRLGVASRRDLAARLRDT